MMMMMMMIIIKVTIIPIVIGTLGTVSRNAKSWHGKLDIPDIVGSTPVVGHPWNSSHIEESAVSLGCGK